MKHVLQMMVVIIMLSGCAYRGHVQKRAENTSSVRAAYGNAAPDFRANKKKNKKSKKSALKSAKRKKDRNNRSSYFTGRPY